MGRPWHKTLRSLGEHSDLDDFGMGGILKKGLGKSSLKFLIQ
jgi:hypothetical protein